MVPTWFDELPELDGEIVVKPTESAGARDTGRFASAEEATRLADSIRASGRTAMAQPYLAEVDEHGETGVVFAGGLVLTRLPQGPAASRRTPRRWRACSPSSTSRPASRAATEREVAEAVHAWMTERFGPLLYARVDIVPPGLVLEVELTEPSLFMGQDPGAPERFARAIAALL